MPPPNNALQPTFDRTSRSAGAESTSFKIPIGVLVVLLVSSPASAHGSYAGAGLGITQMEEDNGSAAQTFNDSPVGWRILVGYEFTENFALEGGHVNSGEADGSVQLFTTDGSGILVTIEVVYRLHVLVGGTVACGRFD